MMDDRETASAQMLSAVESYRKDARFHAIALSCVAAALRDHGRVDPERADRAAHDIALAAVVLLLQRVYTEDAELAAMRIERDYYKKLAMEGLLSRPIGMSFPAP